MSANRAFVIGFVSSLIAGAIIAMVARDQINAQLAELKANINNKYGVSL